MLMIDDNVESIVNIVLTQEVLNKIYPDKWYIDRNRNPHKY